MRRPRVIKNAATNAQTKKRFSNKNLLLGFEESLKIASQMSQEAVIVTCYFIFRP